MIDDLFVDCTYIKINKSPRSNILPKFYEVDLLDLDLKVNIKTTAQNFFFIFSRLQNIEVSTKKVLIEYDGNFLLNFLINIKFFKKEMYLDCHNSAVENEKGKFLRYIINLVYLCFSKIIFKAKIIVHNVSIKNSYPLDSIVLHTPYPDMNRYLSKQKKNDVLFPCSLNSDEPIELIIRTCYELKKKGYKSQITGDHKKLPEKIQEKGKPFFSGYISDNSYFVLSGQSKVMVCLTNRKKTLLYSPREGISLGLKVIMTSSQANIDFYGKKAFYVDSEDDLTKFIINVLE